MNIDPFMKSKDFAEQQHQNMGRLQESQQSIHTHQKCDTVVPRFLGNSRDSQQGSHHSNQSSSSISPSPSHSIDNPTNIDGNQNLPIYLPLDDSACTSKGVCSGEAKQHLASNPLHKLQKSVNRNDNLGQSVHTGLSTMETNTGNNSSKQCFSIEEVDSLFKEVHQCPTCTFRASSIEEYNRHIDVHVEETMSTSGNKEPEISRCKHCSFTSDNKPDFYQHLEKVHISKDKIFKCPNCCFVTERRQHFEYHMRNHLGLKPFKCLECNYSFVSKSTLNKHKKTHSNLYPYRCGECIYATKYGHDLKAHFRRYGHAPNGNKSKPKASSSKHIDDSIPDSDNSEAKNTISNQSFLNLSPYFSGNSFPPYIQGSKSASSSGNYIAHQQSQDYLPGDCSNKADQNDTPVTPILEKETFDSQPATITDQSDIFTCEFCDMMYEGCSMYIMHMAYHGYENPFTCNKCGETSKDMVDFFLHLICVTHQ